MNEEKELGIKYKSVDSLQLMQDLFSSPSMDKYLKLSVCEFLHLLGETFHKVDTHMSQNSEISKPNVKVDSPDEVGLSPTTCSAGAIPWDFTPEEKEEVINHIRSLGPQYQNSTVILDKSDIPEDLLDQVSFADRDEDEVRNASRQFLSNLRRHREIQNQNPQDHSKSSNSDSEI